MTALPGHRRPPPQTIPGRFVSAGNVCWGVSVFCLHTQLLSFRLHLLAYLSCAEGWQPYCHALSRFLRLVFPPFRRGCLVRCLLPFFVILLFLGSLFGKIFGSKLLFLGGCVGLVCFGGFLLIVFALFFGVSLPKLFGKNSIDVRSGFSGFVLSSLGFFVVVVVFVFVFFFKRYRSGSNRTPFTRTCLSGSFSFFCPAAFVCPSEALFLGRGESYLDLFYVGSFVFEGFLSGLVYECILCVLPLRGWTSSHQVSVSDSKEGSLCVLAVCVRKAHFTGLLSAESYEITLSSIQFLDS